jgi:tRNA uridine 5-carboxymethylaminomethyl modification enzyme
VAILTAGTFLNGLIHIGLFHYEAGRSGEFAAKGMTESLVYYGFRSGRLKTGTPPRINGKTIDFAKMTIQPGDDEPQPFSFQTEKIKQSQLPCYLTHTTEKTHEILKSGLDRSPLYTGVIVGTGPRYCPSIETKIVRFADKDSHQLYLEPEGRSTNEYYLNGFSTSLPEDIQVEAVHSIPGLENAEITRLAYAIEYDFFPPDQLHATLETKLVDNLYFAGQINGTSGYEEAAAQGLMAGINAALKLKQQPPFYLDRSQAYIGVLIDDLVTKEIEEPYRMFTSLAEYRLFLRQDNADQRLMEFGHQFGLISEPVYQKFLEKQKLVNQYITEFKSLRLAPDLINPILEREKTAPITEKESLTQILKRPEINLLKLMDIISHPILDMQNPKDCFLSSVREQVEIEIKYEGYLERQRQQIEKFQKTEHVIIPDRFDFSALPSLSKEAKEKLIKIKPRSIGQMSRIAGVSPSDISVVLIKLRK